MRSEGGPDLIDGLVTLKPHVGMGNAESMGSKPGKEERGMDSLPTHSPDPSRRVHVLEEQAGVQSWPGGAWAGGTQERRVRDW